MRYFSNHLSHYHKWWVYLQWDGSNTIIIIFSVANIVTLNQINTTSNYSPRTFPHSVPCLWASKVFLFWGNIIKIDLSFPLYRTLLSDKRQCMYINISFWQTGGYRFIQSVSQNYKGVMSYTEAMRFLASSGVVRSLKFYPINSTLSVPMRSVVSPLPAHEFHSLPSSNFFLLTPRRPCFYWGLFVCYQDDAESYMRIINKTLAMVGFVTGNKW